MDVLRETPDDANKPTRYDLTNIHVRRQSMSDAASLVHTVGNLALTHLTSRCYHPWESARIVALNPYGVLDDIVSDLCVGMHHALDDKTVKLHKHTHGNMYGIYDTSITQRTTTTPPPPTTTATTTTAAAATTTTRFSRRRLEAGDSPSPTLAASYDSLYYYVLFSDVLVIIFLSLNKHIHFFYKTVSEQPCPSPTPAAGASRCACTGGRGAPGVRGTRRCPRATLPRPVLYF